MLVRVSTWNLLSLHVQILLEHLLLIHQLLVELLKLLEHVRHLFRHHAIAQPRISGDVQSQNATETKLALRYHDEKILVSNALRLL